jgi:hypothetical protein
MCPIARSDGHHAPGLIDQAVPLVAAVRDDVVLVAGHAVRQPVVAHEPADVLHHVEPRALRRQRRQGDVVWHRDVAGETPPGVIRQRHGVLAGGGHPADLGEVQARRRGVAERRHRRRALAFMRAGGAEGAGRRRALVPRRGGCGPTPGPATGDAVLQADPLTAFGAQPSANQIFIAPRPRPCSRAMPASAAGKLL